MPYHRTQQVKWPFITVLLLCILTLYSGCSGNDPPPSPSPSESPPIETDGMTVATRFLIPAGWDSIPSSPQQFSGYLAAFPLLTADQQPVDYAGKALNGDFIAVLDFPAEGQSGMHTLQSLVALYAQYCFDHQLYDQLVFRISEEQVFSFSQWMQGYRPIISANQVRWELMTTASNTLLDLRGFMEALYPFITLDYIASALTPITPSDVQGGDIYLPGGGSDMSAFLVLMAASNHDRSDRIVLPVHGGLLAQQLYVPGAKDANPWISVSQLQTGTFYRFKAI